VWFGVRERKGCDQLLSENEKEEDVTFMTPR
jgi:hypothetical protein